MQQIFILVFFFFLAFLSAASDNDDNYPTMTLTERGTGMLVERQISKQETK